jgi:hypothetical protein
MAFAYFRLNVSDLDERLGKAQPAETSKDDGRVVVWSIEVTYPDPKRPDLVVR